MTVIDELVIEMRAKEIFNRANMRDRVWGDLAVARVPGGNTQIALSDEEQDVFLKQAHDELLAEQK